MKDSMSYTFLRFLQQNDVSVFNKRCYYILLLDTLNFTVSRRLFNILASTPVKFPLATKSRFLFVSGNGIGRTV